MKNDNYDYIDLGEEISKTVKKVLNQQDFYDLKYTINKTMRNIPGMGGGPFYNGPFGGDFPPLSKDVPAEERQSYEAPNASGSASRSYGASRDAGSARRDHPYQQQRSQKRHARQEWRQSSHQPNDQANRHPNNQPNHYQYKVHRKHRGASSVPSTLMIVFGSIGTAFTGLLIPVVAAAGAYMGGAQLAEISSAALCVPLIGFLGLIFGGISRKKRFKRLRLYQNVLNGRTYCTIRELSAASGLKPEFLVKDIRKMIRGGLFSEGYMDQQETCLMTDYKTYEQYLKTMKYAEQQREEEKRENERWANHQGGSELRQTIEEGKDYIRTIKAANDALPEVEISDKLDQLELVTTKIFDYVEQHPEKLPEIRKFMCYYMPITLKLVNAYQKFDRHGANASEIEATKLEIKGTIDTINKAYENLLRKLMKADILDVSSDISALETILAQEGLTGDPFHTKMN
ncbi:hypothetical protein FRZ06_10465 [Anoxybacterium hadale]|uniref:Uncharacterized protein n=1 Tax=Anoxybacterium hadale TaxID=3408580 RepID=A0ACD1ABS1_9FIRM|nr:hypothetical protein FRZ06_10465 [Clostridiales bacterium]